MLRQSKISEAKGSRPTSSVLLTKRALPRHVGPSSPPNPDEVGPSHTENFSLNSFLALPHDREAAAMSCQRWQMRWRASMAAVYCINLFFSILPDSKRQQTTTVDYKRLINGLVLTRFASLRHNSNSLDYDHEEKAIHGHHQGCRR